MISFTIQQVFQEVGFGRKSDSVLDERYVDCVYVVHEDGIAYYVGMTEGFFLDRFHSHLGFATRGKRQVSNLGEFVLANWPVSLAWTVDLWKGDEILKKFRPPGTEGFVRLFARDAEAFMIQEFRPCLNIARRRGLEANPIPEKYKRARG